MGVKWPWREADHFPPSTADLYYHYPMGLHDVLLNEAEGQFYIYINQNTHIIKLCSLCLYRKEMYRKIVHDYALYVT